MRIFNTGHQRSMQSAHRNSLWGSSFKWSALAAGLLAASGLQASGGFDVEPVGPDVIETPVERVFIPKGFDENDNAEIIIRGTFPDACHRLGQAEAKVDPLSKQVIIESRSYRYKNTFCLQAVTPFLQSVKVGILRSGDYDVVVNGLSETRTRFFVKKSSNPEGPDDYFYAPVKDARIYKESSGDQVLELSGEYPYMLTGCAVMDRIEMNIAPADVLVVLPIMKVLEDEEACASIPNRFRIEKKLRQKFVGSGIIHVRVIDGNSVNRIITGVD